MAQEPNGCPSSLFSDTSSTPSEIWTPSEPSAPEELEVIGSKSYNLSKPKARPARPLKKKVKRRTAELAELADLARPVGKYYTVNLPLKGTPLPIELHAERVEELHKAARADNVDGVKKLLTEKSLLEDVNFKASKDFQSRFVAEATYPCTVLQVAAFHGSHAVVSLLLEEAANVNTVGNSPLLFTPLHLAAAQGHKVGFCLSVSSFAGYREHAHGEEGR